MGMFDEIHVPAGIHLDGIPDDHGPLEFHTKAFECLLDRYVLNYAGLSINDAPVDYTGVLRLYGDGDVFIVLCKGKLISTHQKLHDAEETAKFLSPVCNPRQHSWLFYSPTGVAEGDEIWFRYKSGDTVAVFINQHSTVRVPIESIDEDKTPFYITDQDQHGGDRWQITRIVQEG